MSDPSDPDLSAPPAPNDSIDALLGAAVLPQTPTSLPAIAIGDLLRGRFRIEHLIGVGGMGSVYLATDSALERSVAIKMHHSRGGVERLHREAVAMARLAHPNVIAVFEVGDHADQAFVAMEYVPGTTLRVWAAKTRRTIRERLGMLEGAGIGLAAAHAVGLVHRDFKPENVLVGDDDRPRVGDFGLARGSAFSSLEDTLDGHAPLVDSGALDTPLTRTGAVLGTPAYMAPEQACGGRVDGRADQFAFAVVAWELLYGERPFAGSTIGELDRAIAKGPRRPPRHAGVRASLRRVLERALDADPAERYPDMHDLLRAFTRASRSRVPLALGGMGALGAGAAIALAVLSGAAAPSCDGAGAEIATLSRDPPARIRAIGGPLSRDAGDRVAGSLDRFATRYHALATAASRAGARRAGPCGCAPSRCSPTRRP